MNILPTNNKEWGFWGTMSRTGAEPETAWAHAVRAIVERTGCSSGAARDFLDSRHGRHFADEIANFLAAGMSDAERAVGAAADRWMDWRIGRSLHQETGIPVGLPFLSGLLGHFEQLIDVE